MGPADLTSVVVHEYPTALNIPARPFSSTAPTCSCSVDRPLPYLPLSLLVDPPRRAHRGISPPHSLPPLESITCPTLGLRLSIDLDLQISSRTSWSVFAFLHSPLATRPDQPPTDLQPMHDDSRRGDDAHLLSLRLALGTILSPVSASPLSDPIRLCAPEAHRERERP